MNTLDRIRAEQIKIIYHNVARAMIPTMVAVTVLTGLFVFVGVTNLVKALWFIGFTFLHTFARFTLYRKYRQAESKAVDLQPWARLFSIGSFIGGAILGGGMVWMIRDAPAESQLMGLLLIFAVSGGSVAAYSSYLPAFYAFFFAVLVPPITWMFAQDDVLHITFAALFVLWAVTVADQARRANRMFIESTQLRFENVDLIDKLRNEKFAAEQANAAKSRFLAAASHDLRQPVHALSLFVEAMRAHEMGDEARKLLNHIDGSVRAMSGLFGGLLDISRLDAGVVEVHKSAFPVQPLLERICRDYESQAHDKHIELHLHRCSVWVLTDVVLFERVIRNIIANAVKYTDKGRVVVGCRRGKQLTIQVYDTGRGIPVEEQSLIFQEFYQLDNPERDRNKGVGLGLAIVKRLTALLEHPLRLISIPGKGSAFSVQVPIAEPQLSGSFFRTEVDAGSLQLGSGLVLVVDDELSIQTAMESLLKSWGYDVIAAASCDEMLSRIAHRHDVPRLIICDYRLRAHEKGIEVIERLRSEYNEDIPGMLITGDTAPDRLKEAQESGFVLLHKPVQNAKLRAAVARLVNFSN